MATPTDKLMERVNALYNLLKKGGFDIVNDKGEVISSLDLPFTMNELDTNVMKLAVIMFSLNYGLQNDKNGNLEIESKKISFEIFIETLSRYFKASVFLVLSFFSLVVSKKSRFIFFQLSFEIDVLKS
jgi:hypothetical protein